MYMADWNLLGTSAVFDPKSALYFWLVLVSYRLGQFLNSRCSGTLLQEFSTETNALCIRESQGGTH